MTTPDPKATAAILGLHREMIRVLGPDAVDELVRDFVPRPVVLLGGDQATGKTTAARAIAKELDGPAGSAGAIVRSDAVASGITFEQMIARLRADPDEDVRHDHLAAEAIGSGRVAVFEGRLAGHLGAWLRSLGRTGLVSVYLQCPPRERALRWLARSTSPELRAEIERRIDVPRDTDFEHTVAALLALRDPRVAPFAEAMERTATRDRDDRARLSKLYGFDYGDTSVFDTVFDTSATESPETARRILELVASR
jgi:cytidylate kinase